MSLVITDLGLLLRVAILEAIVENSCMASFPHAPYLSATTGMQTQPSSVHLGSFSSCFRSSVVSAAAVAVTLASNIIW